MSDIHFSNYRLEQGTDYFLYIGELKNYGLNIYLKEALGRTHNRPFDFIAIVPDVFEQYNYDNLLVINPLAAALENEYGTRVCCRISSHDFAACVSESTHVKELVEQILAQQDRLWIYMYESLETMTLDSIPGVSILGPDKTIAKKLNSKIYQCRELEQVLPVVDFRICETYQELLETADSLWQFWADGIFVSMEYSAAGINSTLAKSQADITQKFGPENAPFMISRYMPHTHDPTVLAVVAAEEDIYVAGIADQHIEGGNRFTGSSFPSLLPTHICDKLRELTITTGRWLAGQGYRGIFGCDYIVDDKERIHFLEINARKQGTTLEFCCTLEQTLPPGSPMLPELEYFSVTRGSFPEGTIEMNKNVKNLHWGTYNYKIHEKVYTNGYFPQYVRERQAFKKVAQGKLKKDFMILEHAGSDFIVAEGSFIGRIVALGDNHASVQQGIYQGRRALETTFDTNFPEVM